MVSHRIEPRSNRAVRLGVSLALLFAAVFAVGALIGYHSVYRNISVAMITPAGVPPHL